MEYSNKDKLDWTMIFIYEFGKRFGLTVKQSFIKLERQNCRYTSNKFNACLSKGLCLLQIIRKVETLSKILSRL